MKTCTRRNAWPRMWLMALILLLGTSTVVLASFDSSFEKAAAGLPSFLSSSSSHPKKSTPLAGGARRLMSAERMLEFGDYAEYPDTCPYETSCPVICVANQTDCPTDCPDGLQLCETGVCLEDCSAETNVVENPCYCETLPFACAKVVDIFASCFDQFQDYYDVNAECLEAQEDALPQVDFQGPWFLAFTFILVIVTALTVFWGAWNTYVPVPHSTHTLKPDAQNSEELWVLTGYQYHPVGLFIHGLVVATLIGFQVLMLLLTIWYYTQQEAERVAHWTPVFYDEVQVLKAFEIVWMVGFVWSFAFRYPSSIRDLFLRRCPLASASFVAVMAPTKRVESAEDSIPGWGDALLNALWKPFDLALRWAFSYPYNMPGYEIVYCPISQKNGKRSFYYRLRFFVYGQDDDQDGATMSFQPGNYQVGRTLEDFLNKSSGLTTDEAQKQLGACGPNSIPMKQPNILRSIIEEFSRPFYLYQNFMVWSWAPYWYYYMAIVNSVVRVAGGIVVSFFQYNSDSVLYQLSHVEGNSTVLRDGQRVEITNSEIVPGDVVVLKPGNLCCDMVVLQAGGGGSLVVDESALTGEATPIVKSDIDRAMSKAQFDAYRHKSFTLSAGTEILEVHEEGEGALGLVLATGSFTSKGRLVTNVLSYQRHKFKFDDEVKVVLFILLIEMIILVISVFQFIDEEQWVYAWFYAIFVVGTVIPPLLPTVFVVSVGISANRLQANRITCSYQEGILIAGKVNTAFFDKTGTLTKQGMDFISLDSETDALKEKATVGMGVCHTLHKTIDGQLIGNHIDSVSFEHAGAQMLQKEGQTARIGVLGQTYNVIKQYDFDSHRSTQSVVVTDGGARGSVFVKGSPEAIRALCSSGVPANFEETVKRSAKSGVYQLVIATKDFDTKHGLKDSSRDEVESELQFLGFLNFQNSMRDETPGVIQELMEGDVTVSMITGDSVLTGICIAKSSGIIPEGHRVLVAHKTDDGGDAVAWVDSDTDIEVSAPTSQMLYTHSADLAVSGEAWNVLLQDDPKYATDIAPFIRVYGRCSPSDKVSVVSHHVSQGKKTLMCGDGGNDCGSLKSAHVGIALSTAEASVVAPFTSLDKEITSVTQVLREGRCALASAFSAYSYYIIYGQIESYLQVINAYFAITFTEWCWVFLDGIWSTLMAFSLPLAKSAGKLSPSRPTASLLGPRTMMSVCGMLVWNFLFLVIGLAVLWNEDWFQCRKWSSDDVSDIKSIGDNYETTLLFMVGGFQYIASAIALNFGYSYRDYFFKNYLFVFLASVFTLMHFIVALHPSEFSCIWRVNCDNENAVRWVTTSYPVAISNAWNTTLMPVEFRWKLVGIMAGNLVVLCLWQYFFVNGYFASKLLEKKTGLTSRDSNLSTKKLISMDDAEVSDTVAVGEVIPVEDSLE